MTQLSRPRARGTIAARENIASNKNLTPTRAGNDHHQRQKHILCFCGLRDHEGTLTGLRRQR